MMMVVGRVAKSDLGRTSDDLHFGKTFSWPLSKKDTLVKAEAIAKKQQGISTSISQLVVNLVTEFVERNEAIIYSNAVNPINIQYCSNNNCLHDNKGNKPDTLDDLLDQVNEILYGFMTDHKDILRSDDFTRIEACAIQILRHKVVLYYYHRQFTFFLFLFLHKIKIYLQTLLLVLTWFQDNFYSLNTLTPTV
jgi:hypothetical protein